MVSGVAGSDAAGADSPGLVAAVSSGVAVAPVFLLVIRGRWVALRASSRV